MTRWQAGRRERTAAPGVSVGIDGLVERAETDENVPVGADEAGEERGEPAEDPPDGAGVLGSLDCMQRRPAAQVSRAASVSARRRDRHPVSSSRFLPWCWCWPGTSRHLTDGRRPMSGCRQLRPASLDGRRRVKPGSSRGTAAGRHVRWQRHEPRPIRTRGPRRSLRHPRSRPAHALRGLGHPGPADPPADPGAAPAAAPSGPGQAAGRAGPRRSPPATPSRPVDGADRGVPIGPTGVEPDGLGQARRADQRRRDVHPPRGRPARPGRLGAARVRRRETTADAGRRWSAPGMSKLGAAQVAGRRRRPAARAGPITLKAGEPAVTITGEPGEILFWLSGRDACRVELSARCRRSALAPSTRGSTRGSLAGRVTVRSACSPGRGRPGRRAGR